MYRLRLDLNIKILPLHQFPNPPCITDRVHPQRDINIVVLRLAPVPHHQTNIKRLPDLDIVLQFEIEVYVVEVLVEIIPGEQVF